MAQFVERFPRIVPLFWATMDTAIVFGVLILWPPPEGFWYWVRGAAVVVPLMFAISSWRDALFSSNKRIKELLAGAKRRGFMDMSSQATWIFIVVGFVLAIAYHAYQAWP